VLQSLATQQHLTDSLTNLDKTSFLPHLPHEQLWVCFSYFASYKVDITTAHCDGSTTAACKTAPTDARTLPADLSLKAFSQSDVCIRAVACSAIQDFPMGWTWNRTNNMTYFPFLLAVPGSSLHQHARLRCLLLPSYYFFHVLQPGSESFSILSTMVTAGVALRLYGNRRHAFTAVEGYRGPAVPLLVLHRILAPPL